MPNDLHTLDEASQMTGMSPEALRKRFLRGLLQGVSSKEANDGKVRVRLTETQVDALRRAASKDNKDSRDATGDVAVNALSRLADSLEKRLERAEEEASVARRSLDSERKARDEERKEWTAKVGTLTAEIAAFHKSREAERAANSAALGLVERKLNEMERLAEKMEQIHEEKMEQVHEEKMEQAQLAASRVQPSFLRRLFRRERATV